MAGDDDTSVRLRARLQATTPRYDSEPGCRPMTGSSCRRLRWHREDTEAPSDEAGVAPRGRHGAATDVAARTPWQAVATTAPVMTSGCRVMLKATRGAEKPRPTCKPRHAPSPCKCTCREASKIQCHASTCMLHQRTSCIARFKCPADGNFPVELLCLRSAATTLRQLRPARRLCIDYPPLLRLRHRPRPTRPDDLGGLR